MPLDKKRLANAIKQSLDSAYQDYVDGDEDALSTDVIANNVVDHIHSELESKLEQLIQIQMKVIQATIAGMSAITPPGTGAAGAGVFQGQIASDLAKLQSLLADLKRYKS